ncbi:MAG: flavin reductase family protein [Alphaproteobacteria bacterium]|nr:flavin reductase family protein [Alphaproteobacteria bacterium]
MTFDSDKFKKALSFFATGITIVTGVSPQGEPVGVTVNAFTSVSLEPPLVLVCLHKNTGCLEAFSEGEWFAVNILNENQGDLSNMFAGAQEHKFKDQPYQTWDSECPILPDCLVNLECRRANVFEGGDHIILVGQVETIEHADSGRPLLYSQSAYGRLGDA